MKLRRFSPAFFILFAIVLASMLFFATASLSSHITNDDCEALGLPILYIETENGKKIKSKTDYRNAFYSLENYSSDKKEILSGSCKIRGRGNTTWRTRELYKKPYLLKLEKAESLLGMAKAQKWVLMANTADKTSLRNYYAEYLSKNVFDAQTWVPSSRFICVYINGRYEGLYGLTEKIEEGGGRIEVEGTADFLAEVHSQQNKEWNFRSEQNIPFSIRTELDTTDETLRNETYKKYQDIIQNIENVIFSDNFADPQIGYKKYIDIDSFIDWFLINEFTKNHDARFQSSCYMHYDSSKQKLFMGPAWDFDISCGNISWYNCYKPEGNFVNENSWYKRLFEDETFKSAVYKRWHEKSEKVEKSFGWLQEQSEIYYPAIMLNDTVWKNIGHRQWPHAPGWKNRKTYQSELDYMTSFLEKRFAWMNESYK